MRILSLACSLAHFVIPTDEDTSGSSLLATNVFTPLPPFHIAIATLIEIQD